MCSEYFLGFPLITDRLPVIRLYFYDISHDLEHESIEHVDGLKIVVEELKSDEGMMAVVALPIEKIFKSKEITFLQREKTRSSLPSLPMKCPLLQLKSIKNLSLG